MIPIKKPKTLKQTNRKVILNILRYSGEVSIADLSRKVNLSKPTLMAIIDYYLKKGLVVNVGKGNSTEEGGKKPNIYKFNEDGGYAIGMIISANKLGGVITNLKNKILFKKAVPLESDEKFESVLEKIVDLYNDLIIGAEINRKKIIGLAIGAYGITNFDRGEVIFSPHFPSWGKNLNLREKVKDKIPDEIPIIIDNHSRFQVFAEKVLGLGKDKDNIVAIQAGKGMVAGVIIENEIKRGNHYLIGEIGHMIVDPEAREICACGGKGCFEAMVTTNRIVRMAEERYSDYPDSIIFNGDGSGNIDIYRIFDALNKKDKLALEIMNDVINWFGIGISNIILMYDPQIVIIQGIFTKAGDYFLESLREKINKISLFSIKRKTEIKYSELGDNAGVLGAASFVLSKYFE
ncbi:MAG: ROK family transcriptional regulator [Actinomycetota bacterium]|nr:ROK family transcriptional regulator [Actinomycetota bacterium]MDD5600850.1 ROK family transcriptional regulator [Actinomycetota bacterium]